MAGTYAGGSEGISSLRAGTSKPPLLQHSSSVFSNEGSGGNASKFMPQSMNDSCYTRNSLKRTPSASSLNSGYSSSAQSTPLVSTANGANNTASFHPAQVSDAAAEWR